MGIFNYPPDPEPVQLAYYRERKLKAREIDPGVALAEDIAFEESVSEDPVRESHRRNHPSSGLISSRPTGRGVRVHAKQEDNPGGPDDSFLSWLFTERGR